MFFDSTIACKVASLFLIVHKKLHNIARSRGIILERRRDSSLIGRLLGSVPGTGDGGWRHQQPEETSVFAGVRATD